MPRLLFRPIALVAAVAFLVPIWLLGYFSLRSPAAAPADQAKHGLVGSYFVGGGQWDKDTPPTTGFAQIWSDPNDFRLPRAFTAPATTRVDAQIAFGQGKGFAAKEHLIWWPTGFEAPPGWAAVSPTDKPWDYLAGVIWKGYIHLPKAGAYYFGTISDGPSAVYLNQARVALNGIFGGALVPDAFSYAKDEVEDFQQNLVSGAFGLNPRDQYVVSVEIDSPRDLPIEIRYNASQGFSHVASHGGIDLFWVTPDSPRDASGEPIAEIVPADALYAEPPGTIENPAVRSATSTISADHLYFPTEYAEGAVTLTIRLADKDGNPVAGKRVHVSSLTSYGNADAITQPEKPTDENGETTAKIRAGEGYTVAHDSAIFATDITDFVDVSQVAHVTFQQVPGTFFADKFSPYYDPRLSITPHPPVVGEPATIATGLKNNSKFPARVTVTFSTTDSNIGFTNYVEFARVKDIAFQPGESKQIRTAFTPKEAIGHKCYRVEVKGEYIASNGSGGRAFAATVMPLAIIDSAAAATSPQKQQVTDLAQQNFPVPLVIGPGGAISESMQINTETVAPGPDKNYWKGVWERSDFVGSVCGAIPIAIAKLGPVAAPAGYVFPKVAERVTQIGVWLGKPLVGKAVSRATFVTTLLTGICAWASVAHSIAGAIWADPPDPNFLDVYAPYNYELPPPIHSAGGPEPYVAAFDAALRNQLEIVSVSSAALVSLERYQAAKAAGNQDAASRQLVAYANYTSQAAQAFEREAQLIENLVRVGRASGVPDVALTADQVRETQQLLAKNGFTDDMLAAFAFLGVDEEFLNQRLLPAAMNADPEKAVGNLYDKLLGLAADYRSGGTELTRRSTPTYWVGNPHDKQESVDLFIRPISIPPDWKLSVVNAELAEGQNPLPDDPPEFPVREVEPGKHYAVTLPAKGQVRVASVLVPVGELGERTTARWAVEGKIGNDLIGGMVHEMNVPFTVSDLQLAPIATGSSRSWAHIAAEAAAGIVVFGSLVYVFFSWRRRHRTGPPPAA